DDRLSVRRSHVEPAVPPCQAQAVLRVGARVRKPPAQGGINVLQPPFRVPRSAFQLRFDDRVARRGRDELADPLAAASEQREQQRGGHRRVAACVQGRVHHAAVPFPPDHSRKARSEEHTSELQSPYDLVCRLLLEKKKEEATTEPLPFYRNYFRYRVVSLPRCSGSTPCSIPSGIILASIKSAS